MKGCVSKAEEGGDGASVSSEGEDYNHKGVGRKR
jgi:hypothetical protein